MPPPGGIFLSGMRGLRNRFASINNGRWLAFAEQAAPFVNAVLSRLASCFA
jgi:hypothetical protein